MCLIGTSSETIEFGDSNVCLTRSKFLKAEGQVGLGGLLNLLLQKLGKFGKLSRHVSNYQSNTSFAGFFLVCIHCMFCVEGLFRIKPSESEKLY